MKTTVYSALALFFILGWATVHVAPLEAQETAGEVLAKVNKLSPDKRRQALIEGAKAEGQVTWYSSIQAVQIGPIAAAFTKRFPFIEVNRYRVSGQKQIVKIQSEARADRHEVDVINGNSEVAYSLKQLGLLDPYESPERQAYAPAYKDKAGYFTPTYVIPVILGYNTQLVKPDQLPKSYNDLLDPKWKGKMFLDTEEFPMYFIMTKFWGREKAQQYMKKLAQQKLRLVRGRTSQLQLLIAGENALAVALHGHSVLDFKEKGAPVDWAILDPFFAKANMAMLAKRAPHPHAAALFMDWLLEEGQSVITSFGRVSARKGIKQRFPEMVEKEYFLITPDEIGPPLNEVQEDYRRIILGQG